MAPKIVGSFPPTGFMPEQGIDEVADSTAKDTVGAIHTVYDSTNNNWSLVAYYQAGATILQGHALAHDQSQRKTYRLVQASIGLTLASGGNVGQIPRGFAAADVSNTGYYSYRYIAGYCPTMNFISGVASNQVLAVSGSIAGAMSPFIVNATLSDATHATVRLGCVYALDNIAATGLNSGVIQTFML